MLESNNKQEVELQPIA